MRQHFPFSFAAVMAAMMILPGGAGAQTVSLQEQLAAQYRLAQMRADSNGWSIVQEGTLLVVQKDGIGGVPYANTVLFPTSYKDGKVHNPQTTYVPVGINTICKWFPNNCPTLPSPVTDETSSYLFKVGDKVYPTKIDVNVGKDTVTMGIVACDACNRTDPPSANKALVVFQFAKGSLGKASAGDIEDTIGQLLSIDSDQESHGGQQGQPSTQGGQDQQQATARPHLAPTLYAQSQSVELKGMTPAQVEAALGKPDNIDNLRTKQIYVYKDREVIVIFLNGQVSNVE